MLRPPDLLYALDERPPPLVLVLTAAQHVAIVTVIGIVFPLLICERAGVAGRELGSVLGMSMLVLGLGTWLQAQRRGPFGAGFLAPVVFTAAYLPPSLLAATQGGLPLVCGMTIFAGLAEIGIAAALHRLRPYFPPEIAGFTVSMIGIILGLLGFRLMFGVPADLGVVVTAIDGAGALVGAGALALMIGFTIWGAARLRTFSGLIGVVGGSLLGWALALESTAHAVADPAAPWLQVPLPPAALPTFALELVPAYLVSALASALRVMGDITTCQRINDAAWQRPEPVSIRKGVLADGLTTTLAGLCGTVGVNTFSGSIGLAMATGVTARAVAPVIAVIFLAMSVVPGVLDLLARMPRPVMGAILLFSSSFILMNGLQIVLARLLDNRKILVISTGLILGLSRDVFPGFYAAFPAYFEPVLGSDLVIAVLSAVGLNLLFRIGVHQRRTLEVRPGLEPTERISAFAMSFGAAHGVRRDVMERAANALSELSEAVALVGEPGKPLRLMLAYDGFSLVARGRYRGQALRPSSRPPGPAELLDDAAAATRLATFLIVRAADRVRFLDQAGERVVRLTFQD